MLGPNIKNALSSARPFQYLDSRELGMIIAYCKIVEFAPEHPLYTQGSKSEGMYIILNGEALVTLKILGREAINLATLTEGNFVGEVSLIDKSQSPASVIAKTALECLLISTSYFDMLSIFYPATRYKITRAILEGVCDRIDYLREEITGLMSDAHMLEKSVFSEVINSFTRPEQTSFDNVGIDPQELRAADFFGGLSEEEFASLLTYADILRAPHNCAIIKEGEKDSPFYVVVRGAVQSSITQDNMVAKLSVLGPESIFGTRSYVNKLPGLVTYKTCERAILMKISFKDLELMEKDDITLWYKVFDAICKSFVELERSADKLLMRLNSELYNR
jgi:CRP/FNR family cyclic AMP-dependent transcriptional regulator